VIALDKLGRQMGDRREVPPMLRYETLCATLMNIRKRPVCPHLPYGASVMRVQEPFSLWFSGVSLGLS